MMGQSNQLARLRYPSSIFSLYRRAFSGLSRDVWLISAVTLVNRCGTMVLPFLALYLTRERGYSPADAGILVAMYGLGSLGGAFGGGWLADRFGARPVMGGSLVLQGIGFIALPPVRGTVALAACLFTLGLVGEAFRPATSTALMLAASPATRARAFALLRFAVNLGFGVGPTVGGLLAAYGYQWLFWIDGATCLAAAVLLYRSISPTLGRRVAPSGGAASVSPWRDGPFLALMALQFGVCCLFFQLFTGFPLTLASVFGASEAKVGATLAVNALLIALFEMIAVHALERLPPLRLCAVGAALIGIGLGSTAFAAAYGWVIVTVIVWTLGEILNLPFVATVTAERAGARMGTYMGLLNLSFSLAFVVSPLAGGWVYERFGPHSLGAGMIVLGVLIAPIFLLLDRRFRRTSP